MRRFVVFLPHVLLVPFIVAVVSAGKGRHLYTDSFPADAEYDFNVLDPYHSHGAPYGGFSRATASRLASLPLYLPDIPEEALLSSSDDTDSALYFEVRDDQGRLFACRVYHEDELEPDSLSESMFDAPRLRPVVVGTDVVTTTVNTTESTPTIDSKGQRQVTSDPLLDRPSGAKNRAPIKAPAAFEETKSAKAKPKALRETGAGGGTASEAPRTDGDAVDGAVPNPHTSSVATSVASSTSTTAAAPIQPDLTTRLLVADRLTQLEQLCAQIHKGWWSYEWCFEGTVSQFHIDFNLLKNEVHIDGVSDLGTFETRSVDVDPTTPNHLAEDTSELARVLDVHTGGGVCGETGQARRTFVHLQCCSATVMSEHQGLLHRHNQQVTSNILAVVDVEEDPKLVCSYNFTICTPLLCRSNSANGGILNSALYDDMESSTTALSRNLATSGVDAEADYANESIRQILDRALKKTCLQTSAGGWWTYEFCYQNNVRQFHQVPGISRDGSGLKFNSKQIESEHTLGKFDSALEEDDLPTIEDWKRVVNVTAAMAQNSAGDTGWGEGSGAYYQVEYTKGDVCDHTDVTDSAIVAGSVGGVVERASSVRFYCGAAFDVAVHEDSTCHYVVKVKVPALCKHPLFRAPVFKKQVMKCLPVQDDV